MVLKMHFVISYILNNGNKIPSIGLGTGVMFREDEYRIISVLKLKKEFPLIKYLYPLLYRAYRVVVGVKFSFSLSNAIKSGYRLIDTSSAYGNAKFIRLGIFLSRVDRKALFVTTRVTNRCQMTTGDVKGELVTFLKELGTDYVDLYQIHWPVPDCYIKTWKIMEELYKSGVVKNIGVANFHRHHLELLMKETMIRPVVNQVEIHPLLSQKELISYCKSNEIIVEAYTPTGRKCPELLDNLILKNLAVKYGKTIHQVILRWHFQNGVIPIPKSNNRNRQIENISIFDFSLTQAEMDMVDSINIDRRLRYNPDNCDFSKL